MKKKRERGLIEKKKNKLLWRVTAKGYKILWIKISSNLLFENPLVTAVYNKSEKINVSQLTKFEVA